MATRSLKNNEIPSGWNVQTSIAREYADLSVIDLPSALGLNSDVSVRKYSSLPSMQIFGIYVDGGKGRTGKPLCFIQYTVPTTIGGNVPGALTVRAEKQEDARKYFSNLAKIVGAEA